MNTRAIASIIVHAVSYQGKSLSDALGCGLKPNHSVVTVKDAAYIKSLCFGSLRFYIALRDVLRQLLLKPLKQKDKDIECLLIVGLYQLLHTDTPHYAAINETVAATKALKKQWASQLVNKILRLATDKTSFHGSQNDSILFSHPDWMIQKIKTAWPSQWETILKANNQQAPLFLRINPQRISAAHYHALLTEKNIPYRLIDDLPFAVEIIDAQPVEILPGFSEGFFSVQDITGQKVVGYLDLHDHLNVLDACCAPGSKTTHIVETTPNIASLTAIDISPNRLKKVSDNFKRLQLSQKKLSYIAADVRDLKTWWNGKCLDRVLVDAPCSATGVIRRHPDIKLLRKDGDIAALAQKQLEILNSVWQTLTSNGVCVYTTCSIFPDENEAVIEKFLSTHTDAEVKKIDNQWGISLTFGQQVLPGDENRDGFYYALLLKT